MALNLTAILEGSWQEIMPRSPSSTRTREGRRTAAELRKTDLDSANLRSGGFQLSTFAQQSDATAAEEDKMDWTDGRPPMPKHERGGAFGDIPHRRRPPARLPCKKAAAASQLAKSHHETRVAKRAAGGRTDGRTDVGHAQNHGKESVSPSLPPSVSVRLRWEQGRGRWVATAAAGGRLLPSSRSHE